MPSDVSALEDLMSKQLYTPSKRNSLAMAPITQITFDGKWECATERACIAISALFKHHPNDRAAQGLEL